MKEAGKCNISSGENSVYRQTKNDRDDGIIREELSNSLYKYVQGIKGKYEHN